MDKLIARAPVTLRSGQDKRPGDVFEVDDDEAQELIASGRVEPAPLPDPAAERSAALAAAHRVIADHAMAEATRGRK